MLRSLVIKELQSLVEPILGPDFALESPKDASLAHFALPVFAAAKTLKKAPAAIAADLAQSLQEQNIKAFSSISALNGYVNLRLSSSFLGTLIKEHKLDLSLKELIAPKASLPPKRAQSFFLEYVSANPTGPLHIGHARGAVFGDSFLRLANYLGHETQAEYYINDAGKQMALLKTSLEIAIDELQGAIISYPENYYRGEYLEELAKEAIAQDIAKADFANFAKDKVLELIKSSLKNASVRIDTWASELAFNKKLDTTLNELKAADATYVKDGKLLIKSTLKGDDEDRVLVRENKEPTYVANDIVYHVDKLRRAHKHEDFININIWGADHHGYIARMKAALSFLGFGPEKLEVILMQMVALLKDGEPFKMSKRKGQVLLFDDVLELLGADAFRYVFLSKKNDTHLEFDLSTLSKKDASNPVFYINYAYARINQLRAKSALSDEDIAKAPLSALSSEELDLLVEAMRFDDMASDALTARALHRICDYAKNLAASFHKYYAASPIIGSAIEAAQLKLCAVVALYLAKSMYLIGIKPLRKMEQD